MRNLRTTGPAGLSVGSATGSNRLPTCRPGHVRRVPAHGRNPARAAWFGHVRRILAAQGCGGLRHARRPRAV